MPFSLKGFLKSRFSGSSSSSGSSSGKYELGSATSSDDGDSVTSVVVIGSRLCAVQHQQDAATLLSELYGCPFVFLGSEQCELLPEQVDEAITNEVEYLVTSSLSQDDARSVGTVRGGKLPGEQIQTSDANAGGPLPQLVLFFPLLTSSQSAEIVAFLSQVKVCKLKVCGVIAFDGSSTMDSNVSLGELARNYRNSARQQLDAASSCGDPASSLPPLLKVRMGCNYADTYEELRLAGVALVEVHMSKSAGSSVTVVMDAAEQQLRPPKPGDDGTELVVVGGASGLSARSASARRLPKVKSAALHAVMTITKNLLSTKGSDERYRILVSNSGKFSEVFGGSVNALACLFNCGFREYDANGRKYDSLRAQCTGVMPSKSSSTEAWGQQQALTKGTDGKGPHRLIISQEITLSGLREIQRTHDDIVEEIDRRELVKSEAADAAAKKTKGKK